MTSILCDVTNVVSAGQSTSPSTSAAASALKHRSSSSSSSPPVAARLASSSSATGASSITARRRGAARPPVLRQTSLDFFAPTCTPPVANSSSHPGWSSRATRVDDAKENETRAQHTPPPTQPHAPSSSSPACAAFASSPAMTITSASGSSCHDDGSDQRSSPLASRYLTALQHTRDETDSSMDIDEDDAFLSSRNVLKRARSQFGGDGEEGEQESLGAARSRHHSSRVPTPPVQVHSWSTTSNPTRMIESIYNMPQRTLSVHEMLRRRALGMNVSMQQVSLRPVLLDLVSSNEHHVVRCPSSRCDRILAYPFASKFSNAAKAGGKQILAIGDEEGGLTFIDASKQSQWDTDTSRTSFQAHDNAVFDIAWSSDDRTITTASGDQTAVLWDVETMTCTGRLLGHSGTIKSTQWDPKNPNLLATASRDGAIRIWDRRIDSRGEDARNHQDGSAIGCVNMIRNAHGGAKKTKESPKSVTAAVFLPQSDNLLASSGSADSVIKVWDLRRSHSRRVNPASFETNEIAVSNTSSKRPHGISSLVLSPDGRALYSLGTDAVISSFKPGNLTHSYPLATYQHPNLVVNSFYIRLAVSPDSRFISCGSTDNAVYAWDTCAAADQGVKMVGHEKEVSCVDWSAQGGLVSCSDDGLVRLWSSDREKARRIRSNEVEDQEIGWRWCGAV
ncbi:hypothetical protein MVLG_04718 [Microbotryum lychnidis-dioicae p1A1 Lamole]|uniref:Uncharacterized protein n=1 Tax=Microbotryum lychnidis-dioicae (strain p1A1 Lamole / MvSl-1064) TaxID=683840 RepID=U5HC29_USTV1|nr:hypothetical protein MVLG_04718 [Microbotryum lychnidis-dioicae p1A1 Lamole]|eukprot:KDE04858.1 hypothetical protein MVLG_04718 [Microbotryum lychnidis-dioicae p1A1 Lamole]